MPNQFPVDKRNPRAIWLTIEDDTDRVDVMRLGRHAWLFVRVTDMDDACGRDNEGHPTFHGDVLLVDIDQIPLNELRSALDSSGYCGEYDGEIEWSGCLGLGYERWSKLTHEERIAARDALPLPSDPFVIAEACFRYGCYAPLAEETGNGRIVVLRALRAAARGYASDESALSDAMERPVNRIGSTAAEFMRGDITSAMQRGCEAGDANARLMAKMYGVPEDVIDDARPVDWLPYLCGFGDAMSNTERNRDPDIAPEYVRGFQRGALVREGKVPAPGWIGVKDPGALRT